MEYLQLDNFPVQVGQHIMLVGKMITQVPTEAHLREKYRQVAQYDGSSGENYAGMWGAIQRQKEWMEDNNIQECKAGSKNMPVLISKAGIMVDGFIVPAKLISDTLDNIKELVPKRFVSRLISINPDIQFITVGCTEFSINDCEKILNTYNTLVLP